MAWIVPSVVDLEAFIQASLDESGFTEDRATTLLQLAVDLIEVGSRCAEPPDADTALGRLMQEGVLSMAFFLLVRDADREEMFSPYQSERIGSYSYSKMARSVREGGLSGVDGFDLALEYLREACGNTEIGLTSTEVMGKRNPFEVEVEEAEGAWLPDRHAVWP